ncbi:TagK domain-containing protein [Variovorax sp. OV329]|uniref:TagK domain-containing protein n=1 Tax=Variovorax sp. OV329 TaxID=1882825 RepID=UPI0008EAF89E|nr:TagK domain-containing protein [Variovorax sp. OV329]SFN36082.1 hypothetical protein SAMN05444747_1233 [Variovorax sp. OV329]
MVTPMHRTEPEWALEVEAQARLHRPLPEFDLRELASRDEVPSSVPSLRAGGGDSPFDVLDSSAIGIVGSQATAPFAVLGIQAATVQQADVPASGSSDPAGALMDELHDEFIRVLQDPAELASRSQWAEGFAGTEGEPAPSLDALSREAATFAMARDILIPPQTIGQVIDGFDPAGPCDPPGLDAPEDVLRLFAPESSASGKGRLPSLTLREHHALSPDSHLHVGQATQSMKGKPE